MQSKKIDPSCMPLCRHQCFNILNKFLNLFKMLKYWFLYHGIHEGSNSPIAWFQVKKTEITVPPSQSPSVVPLLNSLKKNKFHQKKILFCFDEMFEFLISNLKNWQLLKWWHFMSYWIDEILCFLQPLWTMVKWI